MMIAPIQVVPGQFLFPLASAANQSLWLGQQGDVCRVTSRGGEPVGHTSIPVPLDPLNAGFSPDGTRLAFVHRGGVSVAALDGSVVWSEVGAFASVAFSGEDQVWTVDYVGSLTVRVLVRCSQTGRVLASTTLDDPMGARNGRLFASPLAGKVWLDLGDGQGACLSRELWIDTDGVLRRGPFLPRDWFPITTHDDGGRLLAQNDFLSGLSLWSYPDMKALVTRTPWTVDDVPGVEPEDTGPYYDMCFLPSVGLASPHILVQEQESEAWYLCDGETLAPLERVRFDLPGHRGRQRPTDPAMVFALHAKGDIIVGQVAGPDPALAVFRAQDFLK